MFFFFQAEDGIRDGHVTGVQTCALPICNSSRRLPRRDHNATRYSWSRVASKATPATVSRQEDSPKLRSSSSNKPSSPLGQVMKQLFNSLTDNSSSQRDDCRPPTGAKIGRAHV